MGIKTSSISFGRLRRFLADLGFQEVEQKPYWRFEHGPSDTVFIFRPYRLREKVNMPDLFVVKSQLDWHGLVRADAFDDSLQKTSA
jgi:hypothetical protein